VTELRAQLVAHLRARGDIRSERVAAAFARVPRHLFVPELSPEEAYADRPLAIKLENGVPISSSSQPAIMAEMLEMLALRGGERILEIGAGSGYNAALLAELTGPTGAVSSLDIDADLVDAARAHLAEAGYPGVRVVRADGAGGDPDRAPFDAIVATVGVERIPPAWIEQLREGGRLVVPLTIRSMQKVVAFERTAQGLESLHFVDAGFMMLRGPSATAETRRLTLGEAATTLHVFAASADSIDTAALAAALARREPQIVQPVRRLARDDVWDGFALWLALHDDAFCRLAAHGPSPEPGVPNLLPGAESYYGGAVTVGLATRDELAVLALRGPNDVVLNRIGADRGGIERLQSAISAWADAGRPRTGTLYVNVDRSGATRAELRGPG
jgi:protein-L-isoaspartate(D-aspartate) O-methyltransferase